MSVTLKSDEPLKNNITAWFCISDGQIKEIVGNRTLTIAPGVLLPTSPTPSSSAPYGASFRPVSDGAGGAAGIRFADIPFPTNGARSIVAVLNKHVADAANGTLVGVGRYGGVLGHLNIIAGKPHAQGGGYPAGADLGTGPHLIVMTGKAFGGGIKLYVDGTLDPAYTGGLADANPDSGMVIDNIGGLPGVDGFCSSDIVHLGFLNTELTQADVTRLQDSLGLNTFAPVLVTAGSATVRTPYPLMRNTGTLRTSETGWAVNVVNAQTGATVLTKFNQGTDADGFLEVSDSAIFKDAYYSLNGIIPTGSGDPATAPAFVTNPIQAV